MLVCLVATPLRADVPPARYTPNIDLTDGAYVRAMARLPDGSVVVGGLISRGNGTPRSYLARFNADGTLHPWNPAPNGSVGGLFVDASGNLYVGGVFTTIAGMTRPRIARFDASGAFDASWTPTISNGGVNAISSGQAGEICFGGTFSLVGGLTRNRLACVLASDGSLNLSWDPDSNGTVSQLFNDGSSLYVTGYFTNVGDQPRDYAARLSLAGTGLADAWNPDVGNNVSAILVDATGVYLGGFFATVGGVLHPTIAKVNLTTGARISSWNAQSSTLDGVLGIAPDGAGNVIAVGTFKALGGQPRRNIAKLSGSTGNAIAGWDPSMEYGYATQVIAVPIGGVDGGVVVGGPFSSLGIGEHVGLARVTAAGSVDQVFNPRLEQAGFAMVLARSPADGAIIVGGRFVRADGFIRRNILKLTPPGRVDPNWAPDANSEVRALAVDAIGRVYAAGYFDYVDGVDRSHLVRLLATSDGSLDATWNPQPNAFVYNVLLRNEGLYVSGIFSNIGGGARSGLARLSTANAGLDTGWNPAQNGGIGYLASSSDDMLLVGGAFTSIGGGAHVALAKLSTGATAAADPVWSPTANAGASVSHIAVDGDDAYILGSFTSINSEPRAGLAKLSTTGSGALDPDWAPTTNSSVSRLLPTAHGVYLGGLFTQVNGVSQPYLVRVDKQTGALDPSWQSGANNWVLDLVAYGNSLYAGGFFNYIGGQPRQGLGRIPHAGDTIFTDDFDG